MRFYFRTTGRGGLREGKKSNFVIDSLNIGQPRKTILGGRDSVRGDVGTASGLENYLVKKIWRGRATEWFYVAGTRKT